jgi:hypothetical protein
MNRIPFIPLWMGMVLALVLGACDDTLNVEKDPSSLISVVSLVGDAALGWRNEDGDPLPQPMESKGNDTYEYLGDLKQGYLKISCDQVPSWEGRWFLPPQEEVLNDEAPHSMNYSVTGDGGESGPKWEITAAGKYRVTLNTKTKTILCTAEGEMDPVGTDDVFNALWLIKCTESAPVPLGMTKSGDTWTWTGILETGTYIKFNGEDSAPTAWEDLDDPESPKSAKWFCPPENAKPASGTLAFSYGYDNSYAWRVSAGSDSFTITLDPKAGTVAFPGGSGGETGAARLVYTKEAANLSAADSWEMTENAGVYTWSGALAGWYKFCLSDNAPTSYSAGDWYGPDMDNAAPTGVEEDAFLGSAYAWYLPLGHYEVTLRPQEQKAVIKRTGNALSSDFTELWVIGVAAMSGETGQNDHWNKPSNTARAMTRAGAVWTWAYSFPSNTHFRILCRDNGVIFYPRPDTVGLTQTPPRSDAAMDAGTDYPMVSHDQAKTLLENASASQAAIDAIPNFSWWPQGTGINTITVNLSDMAAMKVKYESGGTPGGGGSGGEGVTGGSFILYGDGCAAGWSTNPSAGNAIHLSESPPGVYTWTGALTAGQLKFHDGSKDWGPAAYTTVPAGGGTYTVTRDNGGHVFKMDEGGTYTITLDTAAGTAAFAP